MASLNLHPSRTDALDPIAMTEANTRRRERNVFLFLTIVLAPLLAIAIVGGYGLLIWLIQLFAGPPGG